MKITPEKMITWLKEQSVNFEEILHPPAETCELSAKYRLKDLQIGGKTVFLKTKSGFVLATVPAHKKVDNQRLRKILRSQKLRFASQDELREHIGVTKGAIPPFIAPWLNIPLYLDISLLENHEIAFNAALNSHSIILKMNDYLKLHKPLWASFSKS